MRPLQSFAATAVQLYGSAAIALILLVAFIYVRFVRRSLPPVRVGLWDVLKHYTAGKFYDWTTSRALAAGFGRCWCVSLPNSPLIMGTVDPVVVEHVLRDPLVWEKGPFWREAFADLLGGGIFNADGQAWKSQRKIASHEFSIRSLKVFMTAVFRQRTQQVLQIVDEHVEDASAAVEVQTLFARYTLDAIGTIGFGVELNCLDEGGVELARKFSAAFDTATQRTGARFLDPAWKLKRLLRIGEESRMRVALSAMANFTDRVVAERRTASAESLEQRSDLLSRFMIRGYDDAALRDIVVNFVLAGRDTTAILLTWSLFEIAQHPEVAERIRQEARALKRAGSRGSNGSSSGGSGSSSGGSGGSSVGSSGSSAGSDAEDSAGNGRGNGRGHGGGAGASRLEEDGEIGYRSLASMPYLTATITEILRLHPSVPLDFKTATRDGVLPDGTRIRKNERVMFVPYAMGRMSELWDRPHEFDPTRHLDADSGAFRFPNAFRFPVFLAGPRMCLGKDMAYLGAGMMLTSLLERYDVSLAQSPESVLYDVGITLWTQTGVRIRFQRREGVEKLSSAAKPPLLSRESSSSSGYGLSSSSSGGMSPGNGRKVSRTRPFHQIVRSPSRSLG